MKILGYIALVLWVALWCASLSLAYGCTATPPTPAANAGFTFTAFCDQLANTSTIDLNNTLNTSTYQLFVSGFSINGATYYTIPNNGTSIVNGGDGASVVVSQSASPENSGTADFIFDYSLLTIAITSGGSYSGFVSTGQGFYVQADMKFSQPMTSTNANGAGWPILWADSAVAWAKGANGVTHYAEMDAAECFVNPGSSGAVCGEGSNSIDEAVVDWKSESHDCTAPSNIYPGFQPDANWHTYGAMLITSGENAGIGKIEFFIDGTLENTVTYSSSTAPGGCSDGVFTPFDTEPVAFALGAGIGIPVSFRNFYVWQTPVPVGGGGRRILQNERGKTTRDAANDNLHAMLRAAN